jgi:hypothetical protein
MCLLTCGDGAQWPESGLLSHRGALHLPGGHSTPTLLRATWRSVCRRDGLRLGPDRSLFTPGSEQVSRLSDDFARALDDTPGSVATTLVETATFPRR